METIYLEEKEDDPCAIPCAQVSRREGPHGRRSGHHDIATAGSIGGDVKWIIISTEAHHD